MDNLTINSWFSFSLMGSGLVLADMGSILELRLEKIYFHLRCESVKAKDQYLEPFSFSDAFAWDDKAIVFYLAEFPGPCDPVDRPFERVYY